MPKGKRISFIQYKYYRQFRLTQRAVRGPSIDLTTAFFIRFLFISKHFFFCCFNDVSFSCSVLFTSAFNATTFQCVFIRIYISFWLLVLLLLLFACYSCHTIIFSYGSINLILVDYYFTGCVSGTGTKCINYYTVDIHDGRIV